MNFSQTISAKKNQVKKKAEKANILNLSPLYDWDTGRIRVEGRLSESSFSEYQKFHHVINSDFHLAVLTLRHFHLANLHDGGQLTPKDQNTG